MSKKLMIAAMLCLTAVTSRAEQVTIETKQMTLVLDVEQGRQPQYVYFGQRLSAQELQHLGLVVAAPRLWRAGSVVGVHGLSCSTACGIFPDQGLNQCLLHCKMDSQPIDHQGRPLSV